MPNPRISTDTSRRATLATDTGTVGTAAGAVSPSAASAGSEAAAHSKPAKLSARTGNLIRNKSIDVQLTCVGTDRCERRTTNGTPPNVTSPCLPLPSGGVYDAFKASHVARTRE